MQVQSRQELHVVQIQNKPRAAGVEPVVILHLSIYRNTVLVFYILPYSVTSQLW